MVRRLPSREDDIGLGEQSFKAPDFNRIIRALRNKCHFVSMDCGKAFEALAGGGQMDDVDALLEV